MAGTIYGPRNGTDYKLPDLVIAATMPYFDVGVYGAVGDGVADDTTEIQAAITAAAAVVGASTLDTQVIVRCARNKHYKVSALTIPKAVILDLNGSKIQANTAGTIITLTGIRSGVRNGVIWGVSSATANIGVHMSATSTGIRQDVSNIVFDALGGRAILCEASASTISGVITQGCLGLANSLSVPTGVLEIGTSTTDCWVTNSEFNASRTSLSTGGFACAVMVGGGTHILQGVIGEISDHGFYMNATESRLIGCRADLNYGHGFRFISPSGGSVTGCLSLRNGRETTNTYDGYSFADGTNWQVDCNRAVSLAADAWKHRYGFNDATNGLANHNKYGSTNRSTLHATTAISVVNAAGSRVQATAATAIPIAAAATTRDVQTWGWPESNYYLGSAAPVNFTNFTNGTTGMRVSVLGDGFTTFVNGGPIFCLTGANTLAIAFKPYEFINIGGNWWQTV